MGKLVCILFDSWRNTRELRHKKIGLIPFANKMTVQISLHISEMDIDHCDLYFIIK